MEKVITIFKELKPNDFRVLTAIEKGMQKYQNVPVSEMANHTKLNEEYISLTLDRLHKKQLINRWSEKFVGYHLNAHGYDCLALQKLVTEDVLASFGKSLGVGKEADVFEGLTPSNEIVAIKVHRQGRVSFRQIKRTRGYTADKHHLSWLYASRLAAEKEYEALTTLYPLKIIVPKPYGQNRHVIVMEQIIGDDLYTIKELPHPERIFDEIFVNIRKIYQEGQIIHGDLSEFNIIITPKFKPLIIDWPQWISVTHPNALLYLTRDVTNICNFFEKKFHVHSDPQIVVKNITNE
jgi:RIO kinase 2